MEELRKDIFCAAEQLIAPHQGSVDGNGEFVFKCLSEGCDRFIKFASNTGAEVFAQLLQNHQDHNTGQVSVDKQNKRLAELLGATPQEQEPVAPPVAPEEPVVEQATETPEVQPEVAPVAPEA